MRLQLLSPRVQHHRDADRATQTRFAEFQQSFGRCFKQQPQKCPLIAFIPSDQWIECMRQREDLMKIWHRQQF